MSTEPSAEPRPIYMHSYWLQFTVHNSNCPDGTDISTEEMAAAIIQRVADLLKTQQLIPTIDTPWCTYREGETK